MARYDRIARISPPDRDGAYPGWLTLRDLEGREREPELGRRARLRFLALRPLRRLIQRGLDGPESASVQMQIDHLRQEVDGMATGDPERHRLTDYLREVGGRSPLGMVMATLDVGAAAEAAGHTYAAQEFYTTGLELAEAHRLLPQRLQALRQLGRIHRTRGEWEAAIDRLTMAATLADAAHDDLQWARAQDGLAAVHARRGELTMAHAALDAVEERGEREGNDAVRAVAAAARCALALAREDNEEALEKGWAAIQLLDPQQEERHGVLLNLATAFRRLGLDQAAESAYRIVANRSTWREHREEARAEHAVVAAEAGDLEEFRARRSALLEGRDRSDLRLAALVDLALGRACILVGETDDAREHLRQAISAARDAGLDTILARAEDLLTALENHADPARTQRLPATDGSRRIAGLMATMGKELVPSG